MSPYYLANNLEVPQYSADYKSLKKDDNENYILILGSNIPQNDDQTSSPLLSLLEDMVSWCIREKIIKGYDAIESFWEQYGKKSLLSDKLIQLGYTLEENLSEKPQQQACLKAVLERATPAGEFYQLLGRTSFRGYISTTYDTFIETAYIERTQKPLPKFYASSIEGAVEACRNGQPFILKLYGDIDEPNSIVLCPRFIKGLSGVCNQEQLRMLLSMDPALFVGFEESNPDLEAFKRLVVSSTDPPRASMVCSIPPPQRTQERFKRSVICEPIQNQLTLTSLPQILLPFSSAVRANPHVGVVQEIQPSPATTQYNNESAIEIFTAYVPIAADEQVKREIEKIFDILKKQRWRLICNWGRATIAQECERSKYLDTAHLIVLIVSLDFLNTDFCYSEQIKKAVARHDREQGRLVLPILASDVSNQLLKGSPFGRLDYLPPDGKPVNKRKKAITEITNYILTVLDDWRYD